MMSVDLVVSCRITTQSGWLSVNEGIYRLAASAFENEAVTWRRQDESNPFVEGTWTVNAVRENVTEKLDVWVRGANEAQTVAGIRALRDALSQLNFGVELVIDGVRRYFQCYVADVTVQRTQVFRASNMALVSAEVPRHPAFTEEAV